MSEQASTRSAAGRTMVASSLRLLVAATALLLCGCTSTAPVMESRSPATEKPTTASPLTLKPALAGLIDRQGVPDTRKPNAAAISGVVVNLDWAEVEPKPDEIDTRLLDERLDEVTVFGRAVGHPVGVRLRIVGGMKAPDWLKDRAGRVSVVHQASGDQGADDFSGDLARFWTPAYADAYESLQRRLAARYDGDPRLSDVVISRCGTLWAEPFVRQASPGVVGPLFEAGFSVDQDRTCELDQVGAHDVWRRTRSTLSFNPYQPLSPKGRLDPDVAFSIAVMDRCRSVLGERCVLANNSIRWPLQGEEYDQLYAALTTRGTPLTFQTAKKSRIGDLAGTLRWASGTAKACSVELPSGYQDAAFAPGDLLREASRALAGNCP